MVFAGAVILPHGAMPFDGDPNSPSVKVQDRRKKMDPKFRDTLTQVMLLCLPFLCSHPLS